MCQELLRTSESCGRAVDDRECPGLLHDVINVAAVTAVAAAGDTARSSDESRGPVAGDLPRGSRNARSCICPMFRRRSWRRLDSSTEGALEPFTARPVAFVAFVAFVAVVTSEACVSSGEGGSLISLSRPRDSAALSKPQAAAL